jgi:hypothetical protein
VHSTGNAFQPLLKEIIMQVFDYIQLYITAIFAVAAVAVVAESIVLPLIDMVRRLTPVTSRREFAPIYAMPKPAAIKSDKDWDNMQFDIAA